MSDPQPQAGQQNPPAPQRTDWDAADWEQMPVDKLPEAVVDRILSQHPRGEARVNSVAARRAAGTIQADRARLEADYARRLAQDQRRSDLIQAENDPGSFAANFIARQREYEQVDRERAAAEQVRAQAEYEAHGQSFRMALDAASNRIQERMNDLGLGAGEQKAIWDDLATKNLRSVAEVIQAQDYAMNLAFERHSQAQGAARSRQAAEQAARSARAAVNARARVDAAASGQNVDARAAFLEGARNATDDDWAKRIWPAIKRGQVPPQT